jgi:hypothetical protein
MTADGDQMSPVHLLFALIGAALYVVAGFLMAASLIVVPVWVVAILFAVWVAAGWSAWRRWRRHQFALLGAGLISLGAWVALVGVGDSALDLWG